METTTTFETLDRKANELRISGRHEHVSPEQLLAEINILAMESVGKAIAADEDGRWVSDPEVNNVWGWQPGDMSGRKVAVVYYRHLADFELDGDWEIGLFS